MTTLWPTGQPIAVTLDPRGLPAAFAWQEHRHRVARIVQQWEVEGDWWHADGPVRRAYLALITHDNLLCVLYFDHLQEEWRLARVYD